MPHHQRPRYHLIWLLLIPALAARGADVTVAEQPYGSSVLTVFEQRFHDLLALEDIPGGAFVVVDKHNVLMLGTHGYGGAGGRDPIVADTVFRLASVSKTFAAELTAMLVDQNRLRWTDPVHHYIPEFRIRSASRMITLADLLGHTTGIISHAWDNLIEAGRPLEAIVPRFAELRPVCPPGECHTYQNVAFSLIDPVIVQAGEGDFAAELKRRIFDPLGMHTASVGLENLMRSRHVAMPHTLRDQRWRRIDVDPAYYKLAPAAGVNASIRDVAIWLQAQLGAFPEIIAPQIIHQVSEPRTLTPRTLRRKHWRDHLRNAWYGLGWRIYDFDGETLIGHGGWVSGYRSEIAWSPQHGVGIGVLLNVEDSTASELMTTFWRLWLNQRSEQRAVLNAG